MIVVQLAGGLGNQMFQYAMGRTLAIKNNCELKIDLATFENYEWHEYSLAPFSIIENLAIKEDYERIHRLENALYNRVRRKLIPTQPKLVHEKSLLFDPAYLQIKSPVFLTGYWQSEKYFIEAAKQIIKDFHIHILPSRANAEMLQKIQAVNAVSLHIRRGNYVQVDFVNKVHGTCSMDYYERAVAQVSGQVPDPVFFIFSDDIAWAKANLHLNFEMVFIDINDAKHDYEDMRLMSACKHHILANSTFSWWGAWLNPKPEKIVIAPKTWFADEKMNADTVYLIPEKWSRI